MNCIVSGASSGIGREIVLNLLAKGHKVLAIARREELLNSLKDEANVRLSQSLRAESRSEAEAESEIQDRKSEAENSDSGLRTRFLSEVEGSDLISLMADLSLESSIEIVQEAIKQWDRVDLLINNAGALINKPFKETSSREFVEQYQANVITAVNLIKAAEGLLRRGSHVVNISSMGGFQGSSKYPGLSAYSSAKGALSILTECLAEEYKTKGISVNALALGAVETEMLKKAFPEYNPNMPPSKMADFIVNFSLNSGAVMSGRIVPVATANP